MMKKFNRTAIGIDQGEEMLFVDYQDGGNMWTGSGSRERRKEIRFSEAFKSVPAVHISLSLWDMDSATNARADVAAENIMPEAFEVVFRTWADTRVARIRIRWMAIGEVYDEDDWHLY